MMHEIEDRPTESLAERLAFVEARIADACKRAGRQRHEVLLVGISKFQPAAAIRAAYDLGLRDFGENYAQELTTKNVELNDVCHEIRWHFTGRVQRNKARLLGVCTWIHGVGSEGALRAIADKAPGAQVLLQVNVGEEQKNGFSFNALRREFKLLRAVSQVSIHGLMTLPPAHQNEAECRQHFAAVRQLRDLLENESGARLPHLSMGMSEDFEAAIEEGATMVRVGTAIFGPRPSAA